MERFWKLIEYLFHPLFVPLAGVVAYYLISPEYNPSGIQNAVVLSTIIITIAVPVIFFFLFKHVGWVHSIALERVSERKIPLYVFIVLIFIVARRVIYPTLTLELYYYFISFLGALTIILALTYFKFKASIHLMGISGFTVFILGLSMHYEINITLALSVMALCMGLVASSRLYLEAHTAKELWVGFLAGVIPQLVAFNYWL
ncbi:MAG: hypothetical protein KDD04_01460 [Sinomicrobium sp.]|nr:hypothetical protein [Sinomicrobium sp.]